MFDRYDDLIEYIDSNQPKDNFGFSNNKAVPKRVRYIGGRNVAINDSNTYREEHRLLYQCPFEVHQGDKFIVDGRELIVKYVEKVPDIFGRFVYYEASVM